MFSIYHSSTYKIDNAVIKNSSLSRAEKSGLLSVDEFMYWLRCAVNVVIKISLGGLVAGALMLGASASIPLLSAASAATAAIYLGGLSDARNSKDFAALFIPTAGIWSLLLWQINDHTLLGFSLLIHVTTSFYGGLTQPNSAISELKLWPLLLGFNSVLLATWIFLQ